MIINSIFAYLVILLFLSGLVYYLSVILIVQLIIMHPKQKQSRSISKQGKLGIQKGESLLNRKIIAPQKLKILVLSGNDLHKQHLDFLGKCINLIKLDLSHNHITKIQQKTNLSGLVRLEVVYLHFNKIGSVDAIRSLFRCNNLTYLTYHHNPLEVHVKNEHEIVNSLVNLKLINGRIICLEERADFMLHDRQPLMVDTEMLESWKSTQNSEVYYLRVLNLQLQYIDNLWAFHNPVIIIQRAWKHFMPMFKKTSPLPSSHKSRTIPPPIRIDTNSPVSRISRRIQSRLEPKSSASTNILKQCFEDWRRWVIGVKQVKESMKKCVDRKDKAYLTLSLNGYRKFLRNKKVSQPVVNYIQKIRRRIYQKKMVRLFMTNIHLKQTIFGSEYSFYDMSGIKQNNRFFYNRTQQHLLDNFLALIGEQFDRTQVIQKQSRCCQTTQFNAVRLVDPESFGNKYRGNRLNGICSMFWASMKVVLSRRKTFVSKFKSGFIGIPQLSYLKNRDKVITEKQFAKSVQVYRRLQKFAANQYEQSMWEFHCEDELVMRQLMRMIYYHNCQAIKFKVKNQRGQAMSVLQNFEEPLVIYVDKVIRRTCAAVMIQKTWRRFLSNKNQAESIYYKMKKNRAALHIQRFFRDSIYRHRQCFSKKLARDLAKLKTSTLLYPLSFYMNIHEIFSEHPTTILYKGIRISRSGREIGLNQEFNRSIIQKAIRELYFEGQRLGTESFMAEVDLYNIFHYNVDVSILERNNYSFISLGFDSQKTANIVASIIALLTYQLWGRYYVWPLSKENSSLWQPLLNQYLHIKKVLPFVEPYKAEGDGVIAKKQLQEHGLFMWLPASSINLNELQLPSSKMDVDFYQKRYHNFPVRQISTVVYTIFNEPLQTDQKLKKQQDKIKNQDEAKQPTQKNDPIKQGPLSITVIDRHRFAMFDQSDKTIRHSEPQQIHSMGQTQPAMTKNKISRTYKEEVVKRQAQKDIKESALVGIREKAKQEKVMNTTLRNLKEAQRAEALRNKVQKVKNIKLRSVSKKEEEDFVQQNNFVMEQQLKMVIMKGRMKEAEVRREDFLAKKSSMDRHSSKMTPSIPSRKSSRQKARGQVEDHAIQPPNSLGHTLGEEGEVVNRRRNRRSRAQSIGAYMRDPSFVHGVFPQEYYPIESRGTSFYFPRVL